MKFTKKRAVVVSLVVSLIAILSFSTLAWFNAKDEITNRFMIADSDGDGTSDFKVDVWETDPANPTVKDQDGAVYENILPGDVLKKNPTVENKGAFDQWIRVYVTFDEWSKISTASNKYTAINSDLRTWLNVNYGLAAPAWTPVGEGVVNGDTITYVYYYNSKLKPEETATLFTTVTIPGEFVQDDMKFVSGDFSIKVKAEALQADNTGTNAYDAFAAYWNEGYSN